MTAGYFLAFCWLLPSPTAAAAGTKKYDCHKCEPEGVGCERFARSARGSAVCVSPPSRFAAVYPAAQSL